MYFSVNARLNRNWSRWQSENKSDKTKRLSLTRLESWHE